MLQQGLKQLDVAEQIHLELALPGGMGQVLHSAGSGIACVEEDCIEGSIGSDDRFGN